MSCAILTASIDAPESPLLVNPTAYNPVLPFQPLFPTAVFGKPFFAKNSLSYTNANAKTISTFEKTKQKARSTRFLIWLFKPNPVIKFYNLVGFVFSPVANMGRCFDNQ